MELYQLRTFMTVIETGSISGAGRKLSLTPSSVSAHIKALETEWAVRLFVRTSQGVELTERGFHLAKYARQTVTASDELSRQARVLNETLVGTLRLGISVNQAVFPLSSFIDCVRKTYPDVIIELTSDESAGIVQSIQQGKIDIGVVFGDQNDSTLISHPLTQAELVLAVSADLSHNVEVDWQFLEQYVWIHTGDNCPFQPLIDELCNQHTIQPQQFVRSNNDRTRRDLVIAGMGVSLLEASEAMHPAIQSINGVRLSCSVSLVYATHRQFDPMIQSIAPLIHQIV